MNPQDEPERLAAVVREYQQLRTQVDWLQLQQTHPDLEETGRMLVSKRGSRR